MLYVKYENYKNKYHDAQENFDDILSEKEKLFAKTQPKATNYNKEIVTGGTPVNSFENYVIEKEEKQIDKRLTEARSILKDRNLLLKSKEEELMISKDWYDIIYKYHFIEYLSTRKIEKRVPFSKSEIDRKLKIIKENISWDKKGQKI